MNLLKDFESKDFIEQISTLNTLVQNKDYESIPDIIKLLETISRHEAIGLVIRDTIKSLFMGSEEHTARFLTSENREIQRICIDVAGQKKFKGAAEALLDMATQAWDKQEYGILFSLITAISRIQPPEAVILFRKCMDHEDPLISSQCIEALGAMGDFSSLHRLCDIISESESDAFEGECDLPTGSAIKALAKLKNKEAVSFLCAKIHHRNPAARRLIHQELAEVGPEAVGPLGSLFNDGDIDEKIFAANILGLIGTKEAGDILVKALDRGFADHPNIRFAIYDALGRVPGMTGLVCLVDGLEETDQMVLMAVVSSLAAQLNPWILDRILEIIQKGTPHAKSLIKAVIASRSPGIFEGLCFKDPAVASQLIEDVKQSGDEEIIMLYLDKLKKMGPRFEHAVGDLENISGKAKGPHILAVDDSKAMLNFYRSVAAEMGLRISTAQNGKEALEVLSGGEAFCLVITDLNMPVMDGIEFTRQARSIPPCADIPILMVTTESERFQEDLAQKAGITRFLHKPFNSEKLQETISRYL